MTEEMKHKISCTLKQKGIRPKVIMNWTGIIRGVSPLKGRIRPIEVGKKISKVKMGYSVSEETRDKISKTLFGKYRGSENPNWIEDRNKLKGRHERNYHDNDAKIWTLKVYKRDNYKCKIGNNECSGRIEAHHILPWRDFVELRYEINNGICLCRAHHPKRRSEEKRLSPYFQKLIA